ncbi:MAG: endonuclease/exonuclease/phosphatase family protein [Planctomycetota bacterium]|nr:MAG: endonuclease/exonuclease/phosphatase family protein [Planctomycetota bacterium]
MPKRQFLQSILCLKSKRISMKKKNKQGFFSTKVSPRIQLYGSVGLCFLGLFSTIGYLSFWFPGLERVNHFRLQYFILSLFLLILFGASRLKVLVLCCLPIFFINLAEVGYLYLPTPSVQKGIPLKVMVANIYSRNELFPQVLQVIQKESPDVLAVLEVNNRLAYYLSEMKDEYPYQFILPRADNFGIALLTKKEISPIQKPSDVYLSSVPTIMGRYLVGSQDLLICATHPVPPINSDYLISRNQQLNKLANFTNRYKGNLVLLGDLNTSPWSNVYRSFESSGRLINSRKGFGVIPTWPSNGPLISIPLDHILVRATMGIQKTYRVYLPGSDHYGLVSNILLPSKE